MASSRNFLVQLHYVSLDILRDERFLSQVLNWLSLEERKRYQCFASTQQANQYLLGRALLRNQLSKRVPAVLPHQWVFVIDEHGKPRLADEFSYLNLHFNLSHSEELVVVALGEGVKIGVDVEYVQRPVFNMALAKRFFSQTEYSELMHLDKKQQARRIAQLWTLKESYLKTNGLGVRVPLSKLEFCFDGNRALTVAVSPSCHHAAPVEKNCLVRLFNLGSNYSLALTIESDHPKKPPVVVINEWIGFCSQSSELPCELIRKTDSKTSVQSTYEML